MAAVDPKQPSAGESIYRYFHLQAESVAICSIMCLIADSAPADL